MKSALIFLSIFISLSVSGSEMNYRKIKKQYPKSDYVVVDKTMDVSYFINPQNGELNARMQYNITLLALKDNCEALKNIQIPYNAFEDVVVLSAKYSYLDSLNEPRLAENIKVKFLKSRDVYISSILYNDLKVKEITPTIPIRERTVLKYSYECTYKDTRFLNTLLIQENNEPILSFNLTIIIPEFVTADLYPFNISNKNDLIEKTENKTKVWSYTIQNVAAIDENEYTPPLTYYSPHFILTTKFYASNGNNYNILGSTSDLYNWYNGLVKQLQPNKEIIKKLADEITLGKNNQEEKIEAIFQWVQKNIHYVAFEDGIAGFKPEEAQKVIEVKYGDCKGMANTLVELLKAENIPAYHTWIGTRHLSYSLISNSLAVNNHMICTVILNNQEYYLDPTDKGAIWNKTPSHLQGKEALIGKGNEFDVKKIPINSIGNNFSDYHFEYNFSNDLRHLYATIQATFEGENAKEFYHYYSFSSSQSKKKLDNEFYRIYTKSFVADSSKSINSDLFTKNKIIKKNKGEVLGATLFDGKKLYLYLNQAPFLENSSIETLETPIYIDHLYKSVVTYSINLPATLKIYSLPESKKIISADNSVTCSINYSKELNRIIVTKEIRVNSLLLDWNENANLKDAVKKIILEENTPLILTL